MVQGAEITTLPPRAAATRDRIVTEAERLFREIGYQKTTVADIARSLGMSPANVYRFFDSKKSLNEAVAERLIGEVLQAVTAVIADGRLSASARLRDAIALLHRMSTERFTANRRMHEMVEVAMSESWQVCERYIASVDAVFGRLIAEGAASGEFRVANPAVAAECVHVAIVRFSHPALIVQCADKPTPTLDQMTDFLLAGLGAGASQTGLPAS